jgi:tetratricopeptide (TPR) repeat protein
MQRGNRGEAVASLSWCIHRRPRFIWPYLVRANLHTQGSLLTDAEADLDLAAALGPGRAAAFMLHLGRGMVALTSRQPRAATRHFEQAIRRLPDHPLGHANLAEAHWQRGNRARALALLDHAVALSPSPAALYRKRAGWSLALGRPADALADLDRIGALTPADRSQRGWLLYTLRRYPEAVREADAALAARPDLKPALRVRAESLIELGRPREAVAAFTAYLRLERDAEAFARRARARSACGDLVGVIDDYTQALALRPDPAFRCGRGWAYLINRAPQLALSDFERAVKASPGEALVGRAAARLDLGQPREALADVEQALDRPSSSSRVLYAAARVMARAGAAERALRPLEQAVRALPEAERRAFWRDQVRKDAALRAVTLLPGFRRLDETFAR